MSGIYSHLPPTEAVRPLKRHEYDYLVSTGAFDDERLELIRGVIVEMSPRGAPHTRILLLIHRLLMPLVGSTHWIRVHMPFAASNTSEPEPDLAIVPRTVSLDSHPSTADLIIEVSDTSITHDRGTKAALYAEAGVPEYWVVNLVSNVVEVHTEPSGDTYGRIAIVRPGEPIVLVAISGVSINPANFLP